MAIRAVRSLPAKRGSRPQQTTEFVAPTLSAKALPLNSTVNRLSGSRLDTTPPWDPGVNFSSPESSTKRRSRRCRPPLNAVPSRDCDRYPPASCPGSIDVRSPQCLLSVVVPADVAVTENADGFCGFGRHGDANRREVTAPEATCPGFVGTATA